MVDVLKAASVPLLLVPEDISSEGIIRKMSRMQGYKAASEEYLLQAPP